MNDVHVYIHIYYLQIKDDHVYIHISTIQHAIISANQYQTKIFIITWLT
jgi:hypothetical protein